MLFFIQHGGFFIWLLIIESFFAVALIFERVLFFTTKHNKIAKTISEICTRGARSASSSNRLIQLLVQSIASQSVSLDTLRSTVEIEMLEKERFVPTLALIAQSAPLIGLLGTVVGLIRAFAEVQHLNGGALAGELAGGIWEALINTAAGLAVAIPAVIAYNFFNAKVIKYERVLRAQLTEFVGQAKRSKWQVIE